MTSAKSMPLSSSAIVTRDEVLDLLKRYVTSCQKSSAVPAGSSKIMRSCWLPPGGRQPTS